ncbi:MAG: hypothetical protein GF310_11575 [candidate division Zixibacteria bacterium]|nr:hypothetical protein [candidate division Zixibacteria bacterium]
MSKATFYQTLFLCLLCFNAFPSNAPSSSAMVEVRGLDANYEPSHPKIFYEFGIFAQSGININASSLSFAANDSAFLIDSVIWSNDFGERFSGGDDDRGLIDLIQIRNCDTIYSEKTPNFTLGFFAFNSPYGPAFGPEDDTLHLATCYISWDPDMVPIINEPPYFICLDSLFVPPATEFILTDSDAQSIIPDFYCDSIPIFILDPPRPCGDMNYDYSIDITDIMIIIEYVFIGGHVEYYSMNDNINCDGRLNVSDAVWLINYVMMDAEEPCDCGK